MANILVLVVLFVNILSACHGADVDEHSAVAVEDVPQDESSVFHTIEKRTKELSDSALANALSGYDIVNGEPFNVIQGVSVDPGMRHQIFVRGPGVEIAKVTNCEAQSTAEIVTTVEQFRRVTGSSSVKGTGFGFEKKGTVGVEKGPVSVSVDVEVSASVAFSNSESSKNVVQYLKKSRGALAMVSASCLIDQVSLTDYGMPDFSFSFKRALEVLDRATKNPSMQMFEFKRFVQTFGTHYVQKTLLGARLMMTKFLTEKARQEFNRDQMKECSSKSAQFNFFGHKFGTSSKKCSSSDEAKLNNEEEFVSKTVIHTYGSTLATAVEDWGNKEFDPVPIKRTLKPINQLFDDNILIFSNVKIDGAGLRAWFNPLYRNYCQTMRLPCGTGEESGCGINDDCRLEQSCLDKGQGKFTCVPDCPFVAGWPELARTGPYLAAAEPMLLWERRSGNPEDLSLACVEACVEKKKEYAQINGVSTYPDGSWCWCHRNVIGVKKGWHAHKFKMCTLRKLPIDGQWSPWTSWGSCSHSCGDKGWRTRTRRCDSPAPKNNGKNCPNILQIHETTQKEMCNRVACRCQVDFYDNYDYTGFVDTYTHTTTDVRRHDHMKSFKLSPGCCLRTYADTNFRCGTKACPEYCMSQPRVSRFVENSLSSFKLYVDTAWRADGKCGYNHRYDPPHRSDYSNAICNPAGAKPCCSDKYDGVCGSSTSHCSCSRCVDFRVGAKLF